MGSEGRNNNESPVHTIRLDAYWIDKYEVTNAQFAAFLNEKENQTEERVQWLNGSDSDVKIHLSEGAWVADDGYENHPVIEVSWYGAKAYCTWAGGRLPTEAEWEKAARGGLEGQAYPWGNEDPVCTFGSKNGAQFASCKDRTEEIGSFRPNGNGLYDMAGNVLEWVEDWYEPKYYDSSPYDNPKGPSNGDRRVARGGSWSSVLYFLHVSHRTYYYPTYTHGWVGFRCASSVAPSEMIPEEQIDIQSPTPQEEIVTRIIREDEMEEVYIPEGEFEMGSDDGDEDESPVHTVYIDAYWIDRYEVTNEQYALCVQSGECDLPNCPNYGDKKYKDHPVVCVDWLNAKKYCTWAGGRLPTEAEWEKAARGREEGKMYPWGNEDPVCTFDAKNGAQFDECDGRTVSVGSFGSNGYGLFDMAGNVWEWVHDWYDSSHYAKSPGKNPKGPAGITYRILRGGSWFSDQSVLRVSYRLNIEPDNTFNFIGFRCASDAN
jgi:formylglycine-generating enzyme required for sulfatase activity